MSDYVGAEFVDVNMSEALFREVDFSRARMRGVLLMDADIDGAIMGLRVNGVEVAPLIEAELNRRHPERARLRPTTPDGAREAWAGLEALWHDTMVQARALPEDELHRSVDGEWSFAETLRHLVFVTDLWFAHAVRGEARPFHPLGLPASFDTDGEKYGIDAAAKPTFDEVMAVRADRVETLRSFLATATQDDLDRVNGPSPEPGWPPAAPRSTLECLYVLFNEEWTHHSFAVRDLAILAERPR